MRSRPVDPASYRAGSATKTGILRGVLASYSAYGENADCFRLDRLYGIRMHKGQTMGSMHADYGASAHNDWRAARG